MKTNILEKTFDIFNFILLVLISATIIVPVLHIISVSISNKEAVVSLSVSILPKGWNFAVYKEIISSTKYLRSLGNSVFLTAVFVVISLTINTMIAYSMSKELRFKKFVTYFFVLTMYFSGGLIPTYLLVTKFLNWYNTYWALFVPSIINVFYVIVIRSQIEAIPSSLSEAAVVDGAKEYDVLFKIIIPSIRPTMAAVGMFLALNMWNSWFPVLIYTSKEKLWTIQYYLRAIVFTKSFKFEPEMMGSLHIHPMNYQMAAIVLVSLPVVAIYPFVQKHFVKGLLVGSVKE